MTAGWYTFGGTNAGSPITAGVHALAGTPSSGSHPAKFPYTAAGSCTTSHLCTAQFGYDGPTGWGAPEGVTAFTGRPHPRPRTTKAPAATPPGPCRLSLPRP